MVAAQAERTRKRARHSIAAVSFVLLAILAAAAVIYRKPIAQHLLVRQLHKLGLDRVEVDVRRLEAGVLELESLRTGTGDGLEVATIEAHFSARGLFASRLDALRISGVRLRGTLDEAGLSFGSLDPLFDASEARDGPSGPIAIPAAGVAIEDARLELTTERGPLIANLELQAVEIARGELEASAKLLVDHPLAKLDAELSAIGAPNALTGGMKIDASAAEGFGSGVSFETASVNANAAFSFDDGDIAIRLENCADVQIEHLSVQPILTLAGPLVLCVRSRSDASAHLSRDGNLDLNLEIDPAALTAEIQLGNRARRVTGVLPALWLRSLETNDAFEVSLQTEAGLLEFSDPAVRIRGITLEARSSSGESYPEGQLRIAEITDRNSVSRFPNLGMEARFAPRDRGLGFEIELANRNRDVVIEIDGMHDIAEASGRASVHLHAIAFEPGKLQPAALFPFLTDLVTEASGSFETKGVVRWGAEGLKGRLDVAVTNASAKSALAKVEQLNAIIALDEAGATLPDQIVSVGRLDFGLELTDGLIRYRVKPNEPVAIESASWKFAGGEIRTEGSVELRADNQEANLIVNGVDLAKLLELVNLDGLSGSGTLEGKIPIALAGNEIEIRNGALHSTGEAGILQYRPGAGTANIAAADSQFATTLTVLENFHYEDLEIQINGSAKGSVVVQIHLAGQNPDYRDGHPIEFNLSVDAQLSDLVRKGMSAYRIPKKIEERIQAFAEKTH